VSYWNFGLVAVKPVLARVQAHRRGGGGRAGRLNDIYIPLSRIFYFFLFWVPFLNRSSRKYPPGTGSFLYRLYRLRERAYCNASRIVALYRTNVPFVPLLRDI